MVVTVLLWLWTVVVCPVSGLVTVPLVTVVVLVVLASPSPVGSVVLVTVVTVVVLSAGLLATVVSVDGVWARASVWALFGVDARAVSLGVTTEADLDWDVCELCELCELCETVVWPEAWEV